MTVIRRICRGCLSDSSGQALVEFAMTTVVLLALVFGVIEIARVMLCYTTVVNAARMGARYAITNGSIPGATTYYPNLSTVKSNVSSVVQSFAAAGTINTSRLTVTVAYPDGSCTGTTSSSTCSGTSAGNRVSVTASYTYDPLLSYFSLGTINLSSTSEGIITW